MERGSSAHYILWRECREWFICYCTSNRQRPTVDELIRMNPWGLQGAKTFELSNQYKQLIPTVASPSLTSASALFWQQCAFLYRENRCPREYNEGYSESRILSNQRARPLFAPRNPSTRNRYRKTPISPKPFRPAMQIHNHDCVSVTSPSMSVSRESPNRPHADPYAAPDEGSLSLLPYLLAPAPGRLATIVASSALRHSPGRYSSSRLENHHRHSHARQHPSA